MSWRSISNHCRIGVALKVIKLALVARPATYLLGYKQLYNVSNLDATMEMKEPTAP